MKYNFLFVIAAVLILTSGAFAYSIGIFDPTLSPSYMNKTTNTLYFKFNIDINSTVFTSGPNPLLDFNSNSLCWYSVTDSNTMLPATYYVDGNECAKVNYHNAQNGDFNFKMIVTNGQRDYNYETGWVHAWSDENAPTSTHGTITYNAGNAVIPVYCNDGMTGQNAGDNELPQTAQGSGCAGLWYKIDTQAWQWVPGYQEEVDPAAPINITVTGTGNHTVLWCVEDHLDTNSCQGGLGEWQKSVTVGSFASSSNVCNITGLMILVLVAAAVVSFIYAGYGIISGDIGIGTITAIGISAITVLIILFITATVNGLMCTI